MVLFFGLIFSVGSPALEIFLPTPLIASTLLSFLIQLFYNKTRQHPLALPPRFGAQGNCPGHGRERTNFSKAVFMN